MAGRDSLKTHTTDMSRHTKEQLLALLAPVGQEHLLRFWNEISDADRDLLGDQIKSINWTEVLGWLDAIMKNGEAEQIPFEKLVPAPYVPLKPENESQALRQKGAIADGEELLRGGKVAGDARRAIEADTGRPAVTAENAAQLNAVVTDVIQGVAEADKPNEDEK